MNKKNTLLIATLLLTAVFYGQKKPDSEKIKSLKIAFFTERLDLSSSEAEAFWPIYNDHEEQMESFRQKDRKEIRSKLRDPDEISEQEAEILLNKYLSLEAEKQKEQKAFISNMNEVIGAKKTILLLKTEEDFKRRLIRQYRKKRGGGGPK